MTTLRRLATISATVLVASFHGHGRACGPVQFETEAGVYADRLPELHWRRVEGAAAYHVELVARVPEGPLVEQRSLSTDAPRVALPRLDGSRPTKIMLAVTPQCGAQAGIAAERMVLVMPSAQCGGVEALTHAEPAATARMVRWRAGAGDVFDVRTLDPATGALRSSRQVIGAGPVAVDGNGATVVAVRRVCAQASGPAAYLMLD